MSLASSTKEGVDYSVPRKKNVVLKEFTQLVIDVAPDLGTRLTFPFILDETGDGMVPFTLQMTNPAIFVAQREKGRNSFVISVLPSKADKLSGVYLGDMFVSVAGYNITVRLRTTDDIRRHYTDIKFEMSDEDRERLIEAEVEKRMVALEAEYQRKTEAINAEIERQALAKVGLLAMNEPDADNVQEEGRLETPSGDLVTVYVDEVQKYGSFSVIPFDVKANTMGDVKIQSVQLFGTTEPDGEEFLVDSGMMVRRRLEPVDSVRGVVSTNAPGFDDLNAVRLVVLTDLGEISLKW